MENELLKQQFGEGDYFTTTVVGLLNETDEGNSPAKILWEIAVKGKHGEFSWQDTYRRVAKQLLDSIPAMEVAGIK